MSLGIVIKAPEGLVLAAESRVTLSSNATINGVTQQIHVNFDNATKLLTFNGVNNRIGAVTYGAATIGIRTAHSFVPEFETTLNPEEKLTVEDFSKKLSAFFLKQWEDVTKIKVADFKGSDMTFVVTGYNEGEPYGRVYSFEIPRRPNPAEQSPGHTNFGITWGGQREIVDRLLMGYDTRIFDLLKKANIIKDTDVPNIQKTLRSLQLALPIQFMPLQDCINLATLFIQTTINAQKLTISLRGCGGAIDLAIITRNEPLKFIQKKNLILEQ